MSNWKKTSLLTTAVILAFLAVLFYLFKMSVSIPSSDIEFSPGKVETSSTLEYQGEKPKNIIVFIADGMGFNHLSLALQTQQAEDTPIVWHEFDVKGWHDPRSSNGPLTDSEASATAMATGTSTNFGHIGINEDEETLENILEVAAKEGYNTGIVTDSYVWDGTPAAFSAHIRNEDDARSILNQIAASDLDLVFGELEDVGEDDVPEKEESLEILKQRFTLLDRSLEIPSSDAELIPIAAIYDEDEVQDMDSSPNLKKLSEVALDHLSAQDEPFALLLECEEMDSASHQNDSDRALKGLRSIQETLKLVLNFSKTNGETLVIFTADHETGGLSAVADFDNYPNLQIKWSSKAHTAAVVPLFAQGPGAKFFADVNRNREIGIRLKKLIGRSNQLEEVIETPQ